MSIGVPCRCRGRFQDVLTSVLFGLDESGKFSRGSSLSEGAEGSAAHSAAAPMLSARVAVARTQGFRSTVHSQSGERWTCRP